MMFAILGAALLVLLLDHGRVLRCAGAHAKALVAASWRELSSRHFLEAARLCALAKPRYSGLTP
jgi:hypothetical protein